MEAKDGTTFEETRKLIRRGRHALFLALAEVSKASAELSSSGSNLLTIDLPTRGGTLQQHVGRHHLAFIAKELIFSSNDHNPRLLSRGDIGLYSNQYTSILDAEQPQPDEAGNQPQSDTAKTLLFRMDYEQIAGQAFFAPYEIARTAEIYSSAPPSLADLPMALDAVFHEIHHLHLSEFLALGFAVLTMSSNSTAPLFTESQMCPTTEDGTILTPEFVRMFLSDISRGYRDFRLMVREEEALVPEYEKYAFNPLHKWPVVVTETRSRQTGEPFLVAPIPSLVAERITQGVYWDFMDWWSKNVKGQSGGGIAFPALHGDLFEDYIGRLLSEYYEAPYFRSEIEYGPKSERKMSCDWIALEGDTAVLIECKTGRFSKRTKTTGDLADVHSETKRTLGKALVQLVRTRRAILAREIDLVVAPKRFLGLIVTLDHIMLSADPILKDAKRAAMELDPSIEVEELATLECRILSARLLEDFCELIPELGLRGAFDSQVWDSRVWPTPIRQRMPRLLRNRWNELSGTIGKSLFPKSAEE